MEVSFWKNRIRGSGGWIVTDVVAVTRHVGKFKTDLSCATTFSSTSMARATRFAAIASIATVLYVLALASFLPVPFVDEDILNKILPAVCQFAF